MTILCGGVDIDLDMSAKLVVGDRVRVVKEINRCGRIVSIHTNELGTTIHCLDDGGWFDANELEKVRW